MFFTHVLFLCIYLLQAQVKSRFQCVISLEGTEAQPSDKSSGKSSGKNSVLAVAMTYEEVTAATTALNAAKQQAAALQRKVGECAANKNFLEAASAQTELDKKTEEVTALNSEREAIIAACLKKEQDRRDQAAARAKKIVELEAQISTAVADKKFIDAAKLNEELEALRAKQAEEGPIPDPAEEPTPEKEEASAAEPVAQVVEAGADDASVSSHTSDSDSTSSGGEEEDGSSYDETDEEDAGEDLEYIREQLTTILSERAPDKLATVDNLVLRLENEELSFEKLQHEVQQAFGSSIQRSRESAPAATTQSADSADAESDGDDDPVAGADPLAGDGEEAPPKPSAALKPETEEQKEQRLLEQHQQKLLFFEDYFKQVRQLCVQVESGYFLGCKSSVDRGYVRACVLVSCAVDRELYNLFEEFFQI